MGIGAFAGGLGGGIGAGVGGLSGAIWGGIASGAASGGGMAALNGGGFGDIMYGAMGGALMGGSMAFVGGAAMMGLGNLATNVGNSMDASWMQYARTGSGISMHPTLTDAFHHYTGIGGALGGSGSQFFDYFIARNGTHLRVDQYQNYIDRRKNGTAPGWMLHNLDSWTENISIPFTKNNRYPAGTDLSIDPRGSLYLGDYKRYGGEYDETVGSISELSYQLQFDNSPMVTFGWEPAISTPGNNTALEPLISPTRVIPNSARYVHLSAKGIVPRLGNSNGQGFFGVGYVKFIVRHASHL